MPQMSVESMKPPKFYVYFSRLLVFVLIHTIFVLKYVGYGLIFLFFFVFAENGINRIYILKENG